MLQITFALLGVSLFFHYFWKKASPNLPPGPKPLPIVGNIRDMPPVGAPEYQHWLKFKDTYGPISCVTLFGQTMIIIHDRDAAHDLFEKNSTKTSGRPQLHFASKLCGYGVLLSFQQYNATHRLHRKLVHRQLGTKAVASRFHDIQDVESRRFLLRVLDSPISLMEHIKT